MGSVRQARPALLACLTALTAAAAAAAATEAGQGAALQVAVVVALVRLGIPNPLCSADTAHGSQAAVACYLGGHACVRHTAYLACQCQAIMLCTCRDNQRAMPRGCHQARQQHWRRHLGIR